MTDNATRSVNAEEDEFYHAHDDEPIGRGMWPLCHRDDGDNGLTATDLSYDMSQQLQQSTSRRKQSKPIRVQHIDTTPKADSIILNHKASPHSQMVSPYNGSERKTEKIAAELDQSAIKCEFCKLRFPAYDLLRAHQTSVHRLQFGDEEKSPIYSDDRAREYPTEYHRLARQMTFTREEDNTRTESAMLSECSPEISGESDINVEAEFKKNRMNDFCCEICEAQFATKSEINNHIANDHHKLKAELEESYPARVHASMFRMSPGFNSKTHHSDPVRQYSSPTSPVKRSPISTSPVSVAQTDMVPSAPSPSRRDFTDSKPISANSPSAFPMNLPRLIPTDPRYPTETVDALSNFPYPNKLNDGEIDKQRHQDTDDFCDLCQKHFCNKYYLRKHRIDVHGIQSDPFSAKRRQGNAASQFNNGYLQQMFLPQSLPNSLMLMNPFSHFGVSGNPGMFHAPLPQFIPHMEDMHILNNERSQATASTSVNRTKEANRPQRQSQEGTACTNGVKNVDAYCEICRKEFCDKYYLRVHKANMHNIRSDDSVGLPGFGLKSSPSNLYFAPNQQDDQCASSEQEEMMEESAAIKHENHTNNTQERQESPHAYEKPIEERSPLCSFLPMDYSTHDSVNKTNPTAVQSPRPVHKSFKSERPRTCDICDKEFADKYALRMHRLNIHGQTTAKQPLGHSEADVYRFPLNDERSRQPIVGMSSSPFTSTHHSQPRMSFGSGYSASMNSSINLAFPPPSYSVSNSVDEVASISTMFSSMVSAKLADRVTCDICDKEVCNKYFLKTHKIKMHGMDPSLVKDQTRLDFRAKKSTPAVLFGPSIASKEAEINLMNNTATLSGESTKSSRNEELLKMGIDPEAYCDICKKEFCSKYFLRTHKLNMHGIPCDKPGNRREDREISRREMFAMRDFSSIYPTMRLDSVYSKMIGPISAPLADLQPSSNRASPNAYPSFLANKPTSWPVDEESMDSTPSEGKSTKSNKEPANMIRVKCDLCNKELCNKYFLRTHKLNKHGIVDDSLSDSQQRKFLEMQMKYSSENLSNDGLYYSRNMGDEPASLGQEMGQTRDFSGLLQKLGENKEGLEHNRHPYEYFEVCHICQKRFKSMDWLKVHMQLEHNREEECIPEPILNGLIPGCQLCGMLFADKLGVQIHMVQEHNVKIAVTPERLDKVPNEDKPSFRVASSMEMHYDPSPPKIDTGVSNGLRRKYTRLLAKRKLYSCSCCDYKSRWITNLIAHTEHKHNMKHKTKYQCTKCKKHFKFEQSLQKHSVDCHGQSVETANVRVVRCAFCRKSFSSRKMCRSHIENCHREERIRKRRYRCELCDYSTNILNKFEKHQTTHAEAKSHTSGNLVNGHCNGEVNGAEFDSSGRKTPVCYSTPCDLKAKASFIMQPFRLNDDDRFNHFVKSIVYLPVYEKIHGPIRVDFHLTPTEA